MKKLLIIITIIATLTSCTTQKQVMDSWIGSTKQNLYLKWGPPERTTDDGAGGEILIYSKKFQWPNQPVYWMYKMMYVNKDGFIYHWRTKNEQIPPTQVDVRFIN